MRCQKEYLSLYVSIQWPTSNVTCMRTSLLSSNNFSAIGLMESSKHFALPASTTAAVRKDMEGKTGFHEVILSVKYCIHNVPYSRT